MSDSEQIELRLVVSAADPIEGTVGRDGAQRHFEGWMGLTNLLEELRHSPVQPATDRREQPGAAGLRR
jgi:hypothetical protein